MSKSSLNVFSPHLNNTLQLMFTLLTKTTAAERIMIHSVSCEVLSARKNALLIVDRVP